MQTAARVVAVLIAVGVLAYAMGRAGFGPKTQTTVGATASGAPVTAEARPAPATAAAPETREVLGGPSLDYASATKSGMAGAGLFTDDELEDQPPKYERIVGSSRVDLQACKLEYSIVSPK